MDASLHTRWQGGVPIRALTVRAGKTKGADTLDREIS